LNFIKKKLDGSHLTDYALNNVLANAPKLRSLKILYTSMYLMMTKKFLCPQDIPLTNLNQEKSTTNNLILLLLVLSIRKDQIKSLDTDIGFDNSNSNIDVIKAIF
jgi:hypothetical protein